ncbi:MAG: hypothetical protein DGJ47_000148 [Rickettsiaceae bacterium]
MSKEKKDFTKEETEIIKDITENKFYDFSKFIRLNYFFSEKVRDELRFDLSEELNLSGQILKTKGALTTIQYNAYNDINNFIEANAPIDAIQQLETSLSIAKKFANVIDNPTEHAQDYSSSLKELQQLQDGSPPPFEVRNNEELDRVISSVKTSLEIATKPKETTPEILTQLQKSVDLPENIPADTKIRLMSESLNKIDLNNQKIKVGDRNITDQVEKIVKNSQSALAEIKSNDYEAANKSISGLEQQLKTLKKPYTTVQAVAHKLKKQQTKNQKGNSKNEEVSSEAPVTSMENMLDKMLDKSEEKPNLEQVIDQFNSSVKKLQLNSSLSIPKNIFQAKDQEGKKDLVNNHIRLAEEQIEKLGPKEKELKKAIKEPLKKLKKDFYEISPESKRDKSWKNAKKPNKQKNSQGTTKREETKEQKVISEFVKMANEFGERLDARTNDLKGEISFKKDISLNELSDKIDAFELKITSYANLTSNDERETASNKLIREFNAESKQLVEYLKNSSVEESKEKINNIGDLNKKMHALNQEHGHEEKEQGSGKKSKNLVNRLRNNLPKVDYAASQIESLVKKNPIRTTKREETKEQKAISEFVESANEFGKRLDARVGARADYLKGEISFEKDISFNELLDKIDDLRPKIGFYVLSSEIDEREAEANKVIIKFHANLKEFVHSLKSSNVAESKKSINNIGYCSKEMLALNQEHGHEEKKTKNTDTEYATALNPSIKNETVKQKKFLQKLKDFVVNKFSKKSSLQTEIEMNDFKPSSAPSQPIPVKNDKAPEHIPYSKEEMAQVQTEVNHMNSTEDSMKKSTSRYETNIVGVINEVGKDLPESVKGELDGSVINILSKDSDMPYKKQKGLLSASKDLDDKIASLMKDQDKKTDIYERLNYIKEYNKAHTTHLENDYKDVKYTSERSISADFKSFKNLAPETKKTRLQKLKNSAVKLGKTILRTKKTEKSSAKKKTVQTNKKGGPGK